jgi:NAD(P)-dependent dehydrogenase (short-subunit alcohol dehydrogenase family)
MGDAVFAGRKVLVTGASRGIGFAVARGFVRGGADVAVTGRKAETLAIAADELTATGSQVLPIACHQGYADQIGRLFEQLDRVWNRVDVAVINAATNPVMAALVDTQPAAWQKTIDVNLTGAFLTAQAAARRMVAQKTGSIVFISSIAAFDPLPGLGAYSVTKAGIVALAKSLAKELAPHGVRVNAVAPGLIETQLSRALIDNKSLHDRLVAGIPLGRHGQPEDVVGAVLYLASDAASFVTGQVLVVDGGSRM